ncbi:methylaspartate mutase [Kitasatospora sp. NBC_01287]|uniref:methylaspartate mutase n=1 Tax=Kitasatospora sp. NBC_01287 TaxID=2903573 RepID=UPI00225BAFE8|nr:methylaspartate mutase [Kitasatospora sp. NBC_01287]MCX4744046.1 methylaspartate mutase [Kitasatospora sp. NBC_01287]
MVDLHGLELDPLVAAELPPWDDILGHLAARPLPAVAVLRAAAGEGRPVVQPRCGVGGQREMLALLGELEPAGPGILSVTIDSHTRLRRFDTATELLRRRPADLNGYPLVSHGWQRGRELTEAVTVPLEVRHGSPDGRDLFAVALAAGITSYEGGGIGYNLPYSKDVPLARSLRAWQQVDALCGVLATAGVVIDRELFGTLTAVLMPPSISLAVTVLEAVAAAREGVRCLSVAYPQGGELHQDVAALRAVRTLAARYLDPAVEVFPVLHEFMGVFPRTPEYANLLILQGGLLARLGGAAKVVSKTGQEAYGIPDAAANAAGIRAAALGASELLDFVRIDESRVAEEQHWIEREVAELVEPVLAHGELLPAIEAAFAAGRLDIPFSASIHARSQVVPRRDRTGAIRYADRGALPFSRPVLARHAALLREVDGDRPRSLIEAATADIHYFLEKESQSLTRAPYRTRSDTPSRF